MYPRNAEITILYVRDDTDENSKIIRAVGYTVCVCKAIQISSDMSLTEQHNQWD